MHSFFILEEVQKAAKAALSRVQNKCMRVSAAVRILLMTPLLSCCVLLNGPSKSSACWNIRAIPPRSLCLLCPHFSKKNTKNQRFRNKKVILAIIKIPVAVSSWESCCLVGENNLLFTLVCWQNPTWLSLLSLGSLWDVTSAFGAVMDLWTTLALGKETASGLTCSLHRGTQGWMN